ncbi:extensin family protein [Paracoccus luteus]|uniref:extensin-like domain-containing protein n=1 Tax=Paracoccus luteus TaxID=2508543 RepID=UPI001FEBD881|nr:extensin family protein [Paracoccus luteus]
MIRAAAAAAALALAAWPAAAQPTRAPAAADTAEAPAPRPSALSGPAPPPGAEPPPPRPQGLSQGRLIPPEAMPGPDAPVPPSQGALIPPSASGRGGAAPGTDTPAPVSQGALIAAPGAATSGSDAPAPVSQGALIPPPDAPEAQPATPPAGPLPPPVPQTLREDDFTHSACRLELFIMGARVSEAPPVTDPGQRDCGIARPVRVDAILPGIPIDGGAVMRCDTARALARWMDQIVLPAAAHLPGAPRIVGLVPGSTYQCRPVVGGGGAARLSEHATGNAVDIAGFRLDDGTTLPVAPRQGRGDMAEAFQNAVQGSACLFFATVLGPGSNDAHDDHLHLDIKARRGGFRLCQ